MQVLLLFAFMACYFIVDAENIPILTNIRKVVGEEKDKNYKYIYHTG